MNEYSIAILISHLYLGGFTSSLLNLLKCLEDYPNIKITLVMLDNEESEYDKEIPENIQVIRIENQEYNEKFIYKILYKFRFYQYCFWELFYKKLLKKEPPKEHIVKLSQYSNKYKAKQLSNDFSFMSEFDCVVSWEEGFCNYVLAEKIPAKQKVGYVHPNYKEAGFLKTVDEKDFRKLARIVVVSQSCKETLACIFPEFVRKTVCIPNRLNLHSYENRLDYQAEYAKGILNLVTVTRLDDSSKALFRLVRIVSRLKNDGLLFKWHIIGDGPDAAAFSNAIKQTDVNDCIICLGAMNNPYPYMAQADLYVQQSYYEGRPVSVDEAMLLGTPALVTDYSSAYEQVNDGINGWIVDNNEDAIYEKLKELIKNPQLIKKAKNNIDNSDKSEYEDCSAFINMIDSLVKEENEKY